MSVFLFAGLEEKGLHSGPVYAEYSLLIIFCLTQYDISFLLSDYEPTHQWSVGSP